MELDVWLVDIGGVIFEDPRIEHVSDLGDVARRVHDRDLGSNSERFHRLSHLYIFSGRLNYVGKSLMDCLELTHFSVHRLLEGGPVAVWLWVFYVLRGSCDAHVWHLRADCLLNFDLVLANNVI